MPSSVPGYVPSQYVGYVLAAANATGLPVSVVAAQINEESGFNPNATSPTGAQGIAQFEPGTWASWGHGSPYNPANAFPAYSAFMSSLLKWAGGNVQKALAAYNAGQGNWQAGLGYANTILSNAKQSTGLKSGAGTGAQTTGFNPLNPFGILGQLFGPGGFGGSLLGGLASAFGLPSPKDMFIRLGLILLGAALVIVAIAMLTGRQAAQTAITVAAPEAKAAQKGTG